MQTRVFLAKQYAESKTCFSLRIDSSLISLSYYFGVIQTQNFRFLDKIKAKLNGQIGYYRILPDKPLTKINKGYFYGNTGCGFFKQGY